MSDAPNPETSEIEPLDPSYVNRLREAFKKHDVDTNSHLDPGELSNLIEEVEYAEWCQIDTNEDGFVSEEELLAFAARIGRRGQARLEVFVSDFELLEPQHKLTKPQRSKIRALAASPEALARMLTGFKRSHGPTELNMLLDELATVAAQREQQKIETQEVVEAMCVFAALKSELEAQTSANPDELVWHGELNADKIKEQYPANTTLCRVITDYQELTKPQELWVSERGLVLSALSLGCSAELFKEASQSMDQQRMAAAMKGIHLRCPDDGQDCPLCGLVGESCVMM